MKTYSGLFCALFVFCPHVFALNTNNFNFSTLQASPDTPISLRNSSILWASYEGRVDLVRFLLANKTSANTTVPDSHRTTALQVAVTAKRFEICILLLDYHADVNAADAGGVTALHIATLTGEGDIINLLLNRGADINAKTLSGETPLHTASTLGNSGIVSLLINRGADVNINNYHDQNAVEVASARGHKSVVNMLTKGKHSEMDSMFRDVTP
jgi:ankyrin repeat protein